MSLSVCIGDFLSKFAEILLNLKLAKVCWKIGEMSSKQNSDVTLYAEKYVLRMVLSSKLIEHFMMGFTI